MQEEVSHIRAWVPLWCGRDRPSAPFRCLDPQYRRELVRVYLTNVEGICSRFMEEKRDELQALSARASDLRAFWAACTCAPGLSRHEDVIGQGLPTMSDGASRGVTIICSTQ